MIAGIIIGTFFMTVLIVSQICSWINRKQRLLDQRLKLIVKQQSNQGVFRKPSKLNKSGQRWDKAFSVLGVVVGKQFLERLGANLNKADIPMKPEEFVILTIGLGLIGIITGNLLFQGDSPAALFGILGCIVPIVWVNYRKRKRLLKIEGQLLNAVLILANSLRGGHSFMQGMEVVSRETLSPLSDELGRTIREVKLGIPQEEALINLSHRVQSKELELIVTSVLIQRQVGGNLAQILSTVADTIDKRIKLQLKIKALTAQGKLSAWIISLLPVFLGMFIFTRYPEFLRLLIDEPLGVAMLSGGLVMLVAGIMTIRKVVNIDV